jgi:sodium-coupled neutral amino acid transporter 11
MIYGSLRTPTLDRFAKVTHISTFVSLVACTTLAISAYIIFTDKTQGNILNNFPEVSSRFPFTSLDVLHTYSRTETLNRFQ